MAAQWNQSSVLLEVFTHQSVKPAVKPAWKSCWHTFTAEILVSFHSLNAVSQGFPPCCKLWETLHACDVFGRARSQIWKAVPVSSYPKIPSLTGQLFSGKEEALCLMNDYLPKLLVQQIWQVLKDIIGSFSSLITNCIYLAYTADHSLKQVLLTFQGATGSSLCLFAI